jgi:REP element-mobilizing transposase RayT
MARGGKRAGAGRKKAGRRADAPHRRRPELSARHPVHVVLKSARRISWRRGKIYNVLWRVLCGFLGREDFRIVHLSMQKNHLHLLVEAKDRRALTNGMKSFATRAARALNRDEGGCGKVFAYRYHATQITTARQARHALSYVLNNWRRHREDFDCAAARAAKVDPYSSALSFSGWTRTFKVPADYVPLPVSPARTSLLASEWQRYGAIDPWERPGPLA